MALQRAPLEGPAWMPPLYFSHCPPPFNSWEIAHTEWGAATIGWKELKIFWQSTDLILPFIPPLFFTTLKGRGGRQFATFWWIAQKEELYCYLTPHRAQTGIQWILKNSPLLSLLCSKLMWFANSYLSALSLTNNRTAQVGLKGFIKVHHYWNLFSFGKNNFERLHCLSL